MMGIVFIIVALAVPRVLMAMMFFMSDLFSRGFNTWLWPVLGFAFMPYTTLAYLAAMLKNSRELTGIWLALFIAAVVFDAAHWGGSSRTYHRKWGKIAPCGTEPLKEKKNE